MKLYSVSPADYEGDQYDGFIIWAKDATEALAIAIAEVDGCGDNFKEGATVKLVTKPKASGVLLASFNPAG